MIGYNELYELVRKEKYSDNLQPLPKNFLEDFAEFLNERKNDNSVNNDENLFVESMAKSKKQLENSISLFKEIVLRRKKKILNLVFVATETGIMKKDYESMLPHEKDIFDRAVKSFEDSDKEINNILSGSGRKKEVESKRMVMFSENVEEFVDFEGNPIGPFSSGELVNLDSQIAKILVDGGKANYVDED